MTFLVLFSALWLAAAAYAEISVTPYGAAQTVSGSCFLLESDGEKGLVDCGLFMENDSENDEVDFSNLDMPAELSATDFLVLTHAHLDHSGRVPLLVSSGFKGKIYSTQATKELALALFRDRYGFDIIKREWFWSESQRSKAQNNSSTAVAHWHEECAKNIKSVEYSTAQITLVDLNKSMNVHFLPCKNCCAEDTAEIEKLFVTAAYGENIEISENVSFRLLNAGHIPGSASILFETRGKKILFSGDLGSGYSRFNGAFEVPEESDIIFVEATYADDKSGAGFSGYDLFRKDLENALNNGKTVWIPALSFNRTQKVLYELKLMQDGGGLAKSFPIYSVSPSANNITEIYQKEIKKKEGGWFLPEIYEAGSILPENANLKKAGNLDQQMVLISSSGDMDKGMSARLLHTMLHKKNLVIMIVNYVSPESPAGRLLSGHRKVKGIHSNAEIKIKKYDVFSDHAGFAMIQKWLGRQNKKVRIYIVHSSKDTAAKMESAMKKSGWNSTAKAAFKEKVLLRK